MDGYHLRDTNMDLRLVSDFKTHLSRDALGCCDPGKLFKDSWQVGTAEPYRSLLLRVYVPNLKL